MRLLKRWLQNKWLVLTQSELVQAYSATFSSQHGSIVLQHLLDNIYNRVYEGTDPQAALVHNARRAVVQEILENIDLGEHPDKYKVKVEEGVTLWDSMKP